ncbi:3-hydroxyacyl-CoA dehydrogenase [Rhodococcus erythropolis]|uniref:3-hydroxyacyl-CoA dehydrogenase n=1 Tax=Rhodococcus erythropolis TaxID=1833 RepID=UPI002227D0DA|nr:3-hydroxyacyl-CoA dehydrogenase family protein [Rhodococcus erythropolis]MCW2295429.1 3-hydroxybutyryl-CoA dehydrogenase [Rhodococcus erythropolis]
MTAASFDRVAVLGVGAMGKHIAYRAYAAGHHLTVADVGRDSIDRVREWILATGEQKGIAAAPSRISTHVSTSNEPLSEPQDLVIEALPENRELKTATLQRVNDTQPDTAILASNTSSLDIRDLARAVDKRPGRVVGLHFFNPASVMKLVEIPRMPGMAEATLTDLAELMSGWGMVPLLCPPEPGYIVNRVARPFYLEAQRVLEETDLTATEIDTLVREDLGFPWGPLEVTDFVGHDVNLAVSTYAWEIAGRDPRLEPTQAQRTLVDAGSYGRKSQRGFYRYNADGHKIADAVDLERLDAARGSVITNVAERVAVQVISEAIAMTVRDGVGRETIDTAMKLGANWPTGPFEMLDSMQAEHVIATLTALQQRTPGERYRIEPELATAGHGPH